MAEKKILVTVDTEFDFGGRTNDTIGLDKGIPLILRTFEEFGIKGLFFINTEIMDTRPGVVQDIINKGHEIGCHGHFHTCFKEYWRAYQNLIISQTVLSPIAQQTRYWWRAPKFSYVFYGQEYSNPKNHYGLLKGMWTKKKYNKGNILYLHPFDIVETDRKAPNLFCKLWYSRPKKAYNHLRRTLENMSN